MAARCLNCGSADIADTQVAVHCYACGANENSSCICPELDELDDMLEFYAGVPIGEPPPVADAIPSISPRVATRRDTSPLTEREAQVAYMVAGGNAYKEIAFVLQIAECTVKTHVKAIYAKLRIHSQTALLRWVLEHDRAA